MMSRDALVDCLVAVGAVILIVGVLTVWGWWIGQLVNDTTALIHALR